MHHIIGVKNRILAGFQQAFPAQSQDISQCLYDYQEVPIEVLYFSNAVCRLYKG